MDFDNNMHNIKASIDEVIQFSLRDPLRLNALHLCFLALPFRQRIQ